MNVNTLSRRTALATIAAAGTMPAAAFALPANPDPIFAAIEAHKRADEEVDAALEAKERLGETLPKDRRRSDFDVWQQTEVPTDDPQWLASERRVHLAFQGCDERAFELLDIQPTTMAGVGSVARYAYKYEARDREWPTGGIEDDDVPKRVGGYSFAVLLLRRVANAIEAIQAA